MCEFPLQDFTKLTQERCEEKEKEVDVALFVFGLMTSQGAE